MRLFSVLLLLFVAACVNGYKILGVFPCSSRSHYYLGHALMKGLAEDGHEVTIVSPFTQTKPIKNYTEVLLEHSWTEYKKDFLKANFVNFNDLHFWNNFFHSFYIFTGQTKWAAASENFKRLIRSNAKFDVIIIEVIFGEALLGLGHHFNAPVIATSPIGAFKFATDFAALPNMPSFVPYVSNGYSDRMNFWQRAYNLFSYLFDDIGIPIYSDPIQRKLLKELFPNDTNMPTLNELKRNVSLVLLNTHSTIGTPRPNAPNMIEVGGLHIKQKIEPLPQHMQRFLDEATNGVIYISLGSNVRFSKLTPDKKSAIVNALKEHSDVRVIIKSEEDVEVPSHRSSDVLVESWFPQESILAHPNLRVFVTHGGLLSTTESVHFGKPVIGISFAFDQKLNMVMAEQKGYAISVPFEELSEKKLQNAFREILLNPRYTENAKLLSDRFRDQLKPPLETAIHWVKHVAKNKGAPHLRMASVDLSFWALYSLDVFALVALALLAIVLVTRKILSTLYKAVSSKKSPKVKTS